MTDRDEVVAELRAARRQGRHTEELEEILQGLADSREVTRASPPKGDWTWQARGLGLPPGTADALLDSIRGDR